MINDHLSDEIIQQYALEPSTCQEESIDHIEHCVVCQQAVSQYRMIFGAIREQPAFAFEEDLASIVLPALPNSKATRKEYPFLYWLLGLAIVSLAVPGVIFRKQLLKLFTGALPIFLYLMITAVIIFLFFQCLEIWQRYRNRMDQINYYQ